MAKSPGILLIFLMCPVMVPCEVGFESLWGYICRSARIRYLVRSGCLDDFASTGIAHIRS
ncbi:hypothetical protein C5E11_00710 [Clavibacter michiganensis]|nr:hypothetical protein C5E11_00710 [Clavibacter michiganensis]